MTIVTKTGDRAANRVIDLDGPDGNAFALLGMTKKLCRELDYDFGKVYSEMTAGDYEHLIETFDKYFGMLFTLERSDPHQYDEEDWKYYDEES